MSVEVHSIDFFLGMAKRAIEVETAGRKNLQVYHAHNYLESIGMLRVNKVPQTISVLFKCMLLE